MFSFFKKNKVAEYSIDDCISRERLAITLRDRDKLGEERTLDILDDHFPGTKKSIKNEMDQYIKNQYNKGVDRSNLVASLEQVERDLLSNKSLAALMVLKAKCDEYTNSQKGNGKRTTKKTIKVVKSKKTTKVVKSKKTK
jgi:hypothetical protein